MNSLLTLGLFLIGRFLNKKFQFILFVPVFFAVVGCILVIWLAPISFEYYFADNKPITFMLGPAVVALGVLLYKQLPIIKKYFKPLIIAVVSGSIISALLVTVLAMLLNLPKALGASLLPLGITTPIAIEVTAPLGGNPAITSVIVIAVGLFGNIVSPILLKWFKIDWAPAKGLAIGQTSHGIGTARAVEMGEQVGTFSGLAMSLNGLITVFTAPLIWSVFYEIGAL